MVSIKPENTIAAQLLYMRRLKCLRDRVDRIVRLGQENVDFVKAACTTLDEIDNEVEEIKSYLDILAHLRRSQ